MRLPELGNIEKNLNVAVMGCAVNGPGEAREADIGIAGGNGEALLFAHGKIIRKIPENNIVNELFDEIRKLI
jgi:(E)-4-hydroxy-3-methylbut-2-enyl-diphosphate synthase